jgi:hypothetical protein
MSKPKYLYDDQAGNAYRLTTKAEIKKQVQAVFERVLCHLDFDEVSDEAEPKKNEPTADR